MKTSGLQLRDIQNVVDDAQQLVGGFADMLSRIDLFRFIRQFIDKHVVEAQNRIHRRT